MTRQELRRCMDMACRVKMIKMIKLIKAGIIRQAKFTLAVIYS